MEDAAVPSGGSPPLSPADGPVEGPAAGPRRILRRLRPLYWAVSALILALVAALIALFVIDARLSDRPSVSSKDVNGITNRNIKSAISQLQSEPPAAATVYRAARSGLVVVEAEDAAGPGTQAEGSLGSGIVVDTHGDILTALHVVKNARSIKVIFADGTSASASLASSEPAHDIAVLSPSRLPSTTVPEVLGSGAAVGQAAFVVGNPLDLVGSLTAGVVSGVDRSFPLTPGKTLSGMIQFDAAVDPGSSGGPLLNQQGQVIGIVTGLANPSGADNFAGIGFAVPIATAGQAAGAPPK